MRTSAVSRVASISHTHSLSVTHGWHGARVNERPKRIHKIEWLPGMYILVLGARRLNRFQGNYPRTLTLRSHASTRDLFDEQEQLMSLGRNVNEGCMRICLVGSVFVSVSNALLVYLIKYLKAGWYVCMYCLQIDDYNKQLAQGLQENISSWFSILLAYLNFIDLLL